MDRKQMVQEIAEHFNTKAKYLGPPTFAFEIRTADETYTIDRQGVITTGSGRVIEIEAVLAEKEPGVIEVSIPIEGHSAHSLKNIVNMISAKQTLIMMAFNTGIKLMDNEYARALADEKTDTLEEFKTAIAKLKKELSPGVVFDMDAGTITFKLMGVELQDEEIKAFMELCASISEYAKKLKHSSYKQAQEDNPKFAFRTWLIRLGMTGKEHKDTRKILLSKLPGSGAFRKAGA